MIKVLINGCNGKMGQEVIKAINSNEKLAILSGMDIKDNPEYNFPVYTKVGDIKEKPDVIIDFSVPIATMKTAGATFPMHCCATLRIFTIRA